MSRSSSRQGHHGHGEMHSRSRSGTLNRSFKLDATTSIPASQDHDHGHDHDHEHEHDHDHHHNAFAPASHAHDDGSHAHTHSDSRGRMQGRKNMPAPLLTGNGWKTSSTPAGKPLVTPTNAVFAGQYKPPTATLSKAAHDHSAERSRFTNALLPYTARWPLIHTLMTEKDSRRIFYFMRWARIGASQGSVRTEQTLTGC